MLSKRLIACLDVRDGHLAKSMGFRQVASGPFVRSSYHAGEMAELF